MQLLFSITVWKSWTQGLRSLYPGGKRVLAGGGRETEEGHGGRWGVPKDIFRVAAWKMAILVIHT